MKLQDFLLKLATDPDMLAKFRVEPNTIMIEASLSESECQAVMEGNVPKLRGHLSRESHSQEAFTEYEVSQVPPTQSPPPQEEPHQEPPQEEPPQEEPHEPSQYEPPPEEEPTQQIIEPPPEVDAEAPIGAALSNWHIWDLREPARLWDATGLTVVGLGIRGGLQTTPEARVCIKQASKVLYLVADPISESLVRMLNPTAESMHGFYQKGKRRLEAYNAMVERILSCLQESGDVCAVFYGHPGVFSYPARESIRRARLKGVSARMLPGISTEDNLIADLGIDPGPLGLQSYEATSFLLYKYRFDTSVGLILWQVGVLGETIWAPPHKAARDRLDILADYLINYYGGDHEVVFYHAPELPAGQPAIERLRLSELPHAQLLHISTLYIPPKGRPSYDYEMAKRLGMEWPAMSPVAEGGG